MQSYAKFRWYNIQEVQSPVLLRYNTKQTDIVRHMGKESAAFDSASMEGGSKCAGGGWPVPHFRDLPAAPRTLAPNRHNSRKRWCVEYFGMLDVTACSSGLTRMLGRYAHPSIVHGQAADEFVLKANKNQYHVKTLFVPF